MLSYLLEVMCVNFAIRLLGEVEKSFSECWVLLPYTAFELFNDFILGHVPGHGTLALSGRGSKIASRHRCSSALSVSQQPPTFLGTTDGFCGGQFSMEWGRDALGVI